MKILTDFVTFSNQLRNVADNFLKNVWTSRIPTAEAKLRDYTKEYLETVDFLYNIQTRDRVTGLAGDFGIPYGEEVEVVDDIIETIINRINCKVNVLSTNKHTLRTHIRITLDDIVLLELADLISGITITEKNEIIEWLEASLYSGNLPIVQGHFVYHMVGLGRSGLAVMEAMPGSQWVIPEEYQGVKNNNWLTRALSAEDYLDGSGRLVFSILNR